MNKRRSWLALVAAVLAVLGLTVAGAPAQADGFHRINVWHSSHCLDSDTGNSAKLQMWPCTGAQEQNWLLTYNNVGPSGNDYYYTFTNQRTGRCIQAPNAGAGSITLAICNASFLPAQQWKIAASGDIFGELYYVWESVKSPGYCLTTPSVGNRTVPQTALCDPSDQYDRWHYDE